MMTFRALAAAAVLVTVSGGLVTHAQDGFRFKSGVELVNVTATVTDDDGRFVDVAPQGGLLGLRERPGAGGLALQQRAGCR